MPTHPDTLPDDIDSLKALLRQRDGELQQLRDTVSTLEQALNVRSLEIEQLKLQLARKRLTKAVLTSVPVEEVGFRPQRRRVSPVRPRATIH